MASSGTGSRGGKATGKLRRITIEVKSNGFEVTLDRVPKMGKNGPMYDFDQPKDSMVFTDAEKAADYVEECMTGKKESTADEAKEGA